MPWKVEKRDDKFCVIKEADGASEGCHDSRPEAMNQMKALYASEEKALKERLSAALSAAEQMDKAPSWLDEMVERVTVAVKSIFGDKSVVNSGREPEMLLLKEAGGTYQVITRYSNKFRDNDHPAEIIASASHQKFAKMVEAGLVKPPDLWLWHVPEWKVGDGLWAVYDDSGFPMAGHRVSKENADLIMALKELGDVRVSHGMPKWSIRRSQDDPTVIEEHVTQEVSLLPGWAAANKITSAVILESKENDMALSKEQKAALIEQWGISPQLIERLEAQNKDDAQLATNAGVENKEKEAAPAAQEPTPAAPVAPTPDPATKEAPKPEVANTDLAEITKALSETMAAVLTINQKVDALTSKVKELEVSEQQKVAEKAASTPLASLSDLMRKSVAESPDTLVDGRTSLAKSGPPQAEVKQESITGIPFVDGFLQPAKPQGGN